MTENSAKHVVVIGAGIVGTAVAFYLTRQGARVTLIDSGATGAKATAASWAWTNATAHNPKPYFDLRARSMAEWDVLAAELPGLPYTRCGSIYTDDERFKLHAFVQNHTAWGYDIRLISPEQAQQYEPSIGRAEGPVAINDTEGAAEATEAAEFFADAARKGGAQVINGLSVEGLQVHGNRVCGVHLETSPIEADDVVVAAGSAAPRIVGPLGVELPMKNPPGLLINTKPLPRLMTRNLMLPGLHIRQRPDGALVAGEDFGGDEVNDPARVEALAAGLIDEIRRRIIGAEAAELDHYTVGYRPTPDDGFPVIGRPGHIDGLYITVMHSGVTLAPIVGRFAADEILEGRRDPLLAPFGVDRFRQA